MKIDARKITILIGAAVAVLILLLYPAKSGIVSCPGPGAIGAVTASTTTSASDGFENEIATKIVNNCRHDGEVGIGVAVVAFLLAFGISRAFPPAQVTKVKDVNNTWHRAQSGVCSADGQPWPCGTARLALQNVSMSKRQAAAQAPPPSPPA